MVSVDDRGEVDVVMENNMNGKMRELSRLHDDHVALMRDLAENEEGSRQKRLQLSQAQSELSSYVRGDSSRNRSRQALSRISSTRK